jgi:hypothetical protein
LGEPIDDSDVDSVDRLFFAGLNGLKSLSEDIFADTVQETFVTKLSNGLQVCACVCTSYGPFVFYAVALRAFKSVTINCFLSGGVDAGRSGHSVDVCECERLRDGVDFNTSG